MEKQAGAALLLTATSLEECKHLFHQQACAAHPSSGGTLQEFNITLNTFSALCHGYAMTGDLQWLPSAESSLAELQALLRRLNPVCRREAIRRLSMQQRQCLEQSMLRRKTSKTVSSKRKRGVLTERSLCKQKGLGFRPCVHLHEGLYVQALSCKDLSTAIAALGTLVVMRCFCRAQHRVDRVAKLRAADLLAAISKALTDSPRLEFGTDVSFVFRTRLALSGCELATPSRRDPQTAVADWLVMVWAMDGGRAKQWLHFHAERSRAQADTDSTQRLPFSGWELPSTCSRLDSSFDGHRDMEICSFRHPSKAQLETDGQDRGCKFVQQGVRLSRIEQAIKLCSNKSGKRRNKARQKSHGATSSQP